MTVGGDGRQSYAVEVAGSIDLGNGFTVFAGAAFEDADSGDNQLINVLCRLTKLAHGCSLLN